MLRLLRSAMCSCALPLLVACGSSSGGGGGDGGPAGDGGGGGSDSGGMPSTKYTAYVSVTNQETTAGMNTLRTWVASGSFTQNATGSSSSCTITKEGNCSAVECMIGDAGAVTPAYLKAGAVTVDVNNGAKLVTLVQAPQGYYSATAMESLFVGGEPLVMKTTGDAMGAPATTLSVTAPAKITLTAPALQLNMKLAVSRSAPLQIAWTGGTIGKAFIVLSSSSGGRSAVASCTFDESAGSGTIPASMTSKLPAGTGSFAAYGYGTTESVVGEWGFIFTAQYLAVLPSGGTAISQTTVQ